MFSTTTIGRLTVRQGSAVARRGFSSKSYSNRGRIPYRGRVAATTALAATGIGMGWFKNDKQAIAAAHTPGKHWSLNNNEPRERPDLPHITLSELKAHTSAETGYWVSYKGAVYDISEFVAAHPGGPGRLEMAAGNDLTPFWDVYRLHYRGHIVPLMEEKWRIGTLSASDAEKAKQFEFDDYYKDDPPRHYDNTPCTHKPYCGECRLDLMAESFYTPNELFYTRNHNAVPHVTEDEYELIVEGNGVKRTVFTLNDLKTKFDHHEIVSVVQCAGNRGEDFHGIGAGPAKATFLAPHWSAGAISNAKWKGVKMRDILKYCGMDVDGMADGSVFLKNGQHIEMESYDVDETGEAYSGSTYIDKVVSHDGDAMIAFEMNGKPLPKDHGAPARCIVPGHAGARQPKWIHKLRILAEPVCVLQCLNFAPDVTFEDHMTQWPPVGLENDAERAELVVQEMPVQSLICQPPQNATIGASTAEGPIQSLHLKGVAWSGGGNGIKRVDVSIDNGKHFTASQLYKPVEQKRRCEWAWTIFNKDVPLSDEIKHDLANGHKVNLVLTSKAVNSAFNVQPENAEPYVNPRGTAACHWYRVAVTLDPNVPAGTVINPKSAAAEQGRYVNLPTGGFYKTPFKEGGWEIKGKKEKPEDWHNYMGKEEMIDWEYYRHLTCPPWYAKAKIVIGETDVEE